MTVHNFWDYRVEGDTEFVRLHLVNFPSIGIRDQKGNLVGWDVAYYIGEMGMLYVMKEHRGKGLAKCLIYELAKKLIELNREVYCYIDMSNMESVKVHEKCGFWMVPGCDTYYKALTEAKKLK